MADTVKSEQDVPIYSLTLIDLTVYRVNLLCEDSICMVNLLVIPQKIVVVFYYMIDLLRLF